MDEPISEIIDRIEATLAVLKDMNLETAEDRSGIVDQLIGADDCLVTAYDIACNY